MLMLNYDFYRKPRRERKSLKLMPPTRHFSDLLVVEDPKGELAAQLAVGQRVRVGCVHIPNSDYRAQKIQFVNREKITKVVQVKMSRLAIVKREGHSLEDSMCLYPVMCIEDDFKIGTEVPVVGGVFYVYKKDFIMIPPDILGLGRAIDVGFWRLPITINIECPLTKQDWLHLQRLMPNVVEEDTFSDHLLDFFIRREQERLLVCLKDLVIEEEQEEEEEVVIPEVEEAIDNAIRKQGEVKPEVREKERKEEERIDPVTREEEKTKKKKKKKKANRNK